MKLTQIEAIVLQAIPFKEYDRILTLFSPQGLLKLFVKCRKKDYLHLSALTSPLTHAEFHFIQGAKDLHRLSEGTIFKQNLSIRNHHETLVAAEKMIQALLLSQWQGKAAPKLFHLFSLFIEHLSLGNALILYTAFLLKILRHEGVLQLRAPIEAIYRFSGEQYSKAEAPQGALFFTETEEELLTEFAICRSFAHFNRQILPPEFQEKIEILFFQTFT